MPRPICLFLVTLPEPYPNSYGVLYDIAIAYQQYYQERGHEVIIAKEPNEGYQNLAFGMNVASVISDQIKMPEDTIIVDFEQFVSQPPYMCATSLQPDTYIEYLRRYPVWTFCQKNVRILQYHHVSRLTHVPFGYMSCLEQIKPYDEDIDVLFIGGLSSRRRYIEDELRKVNRNLHIVFRERVWNEERLHLIARAKIVLNIAHFDFVHSFEIVRVLYLLANQKFVISETAENISEYQYLLPGLVICPYNQLISTIRVYLSKPKERQRIRQIGYHIIKQYPLKLPFLE
jgi:hypothetical protein